MGKIRARADNEKLFFDFTYRLLPRADHVA